MKRWELILVFGRKKQGSITPLLLIVTGAFVIVIYAFLLALALQLDYSHRQLAAEEAIYIAEAGVDYYRWHLAHAPEDFQDGTGLGGPYEHEYVDPQGDVVGSFSLEVIPPSGGSSIVTIVSTGWVDDYPGIKRSVRVQYGKPSLARYSSLYNASVWFGQGIEVIGRVHSNNGIRMDGENTSLVTSARATYLCGSETGCSPPQTKPGVWGIGEGGALGLWQFPVPAVDFDAISFDFAHMRSEAQSVGLYLGPSGGSGYHLVFDNNGTVDVNQVNSTNYYRGYTPEDGCKRRYQLINSETLLGTYNLSDIPVLFAEDHLWVEGGVNGRISVVAARFPIDTNEMNIWIMDELSYAAFDHTNSLGLIAQHDIYFTKDIPEDFEIDGALMAQQGKIIRHGYFSWCGGSTGAVKDKLIIFGAVISYEKAYWNYGGAPSSGFKKREITYDPDLLYAPPPYFPTSGEYEFISWREE